MSIKELVKQGRFILTRDMVPINLIHFDTHGCDFARPLPRGYLYFTEKYFSKELKLQELKEFCDSITAQINKKSIKALPPFENILIGYHERTGSQQQELLEGFTISSIRTDGRGIYGVWAGGNVNSGDIYLNTSDSYFVPTIPALENLLEPDCAFLCHNIDWYWQALLTREVCIEYFNWLNKQICI
jgi:hypothetical protein